MKKCKFGFPDASSFAFFPACQSRQNRTRPFHFAHLKGKIQSLTGSSPSQPPIFASKAPRVDFRCTLGDRPLLRRPKRA